MLASVLNSDRAIETSIKVVETFIALRQYALAQTSKNTEIEELKKMLMLHIENTNNKFANANDRLDKNDKAIRQIIYILNNLIETPRETKKIGLISISLHLRIIPSLFCGFIYPCLSFSAQD